MNILHVDYSTVIRVMIGGNDSMAEVVKKYTNDGWAFLNHTYGEHPEHGRVFYLKFSKSQ